MGAMAHFADPTNGAASAAPTPAHVLGTPMVIVIRRGASATEVGTAATPPVVPAHVAPVTTSRGS
jgi:hypothetical protein